MRTSQVPYGSAGIPLGLYLYFQDYSLNNHHRLKYHHHLITIDVEIFFIGNVGSVFKDFRESI